MDLEPLQRKLQKMLQRKRYLLVLDDVWDHNQWDRLRNVLACGSYGASILVTTRLLNVATIMGTMPPHELSMLSLDDCWELFKERAFGSDEEEQAQLVIIGKEIVNKCAGVPLAAIALGSLLRFKREKREWLSIKESRLWSLQGENSIMSALRISYLNLPAKLKQCFAFCALFPKDERIEKQLLIELWLCNGFISSNEITEADEVWNELYWRSFFQDIEKNEFGKITSFKMHDLVHDLAQSVTQDVCCIVDDDDPVHNLAQSVTREVRCIVGDVVHDFAQSVTREGSCIVDDDGIIRVPKGVRHLLIYGYGRKSLEEVDSIQLQQVLKTYIISSSDVSQLPPHALKYYSLRVLCSKGLNEVPTAIDRLRYLRYLNLSRGRFKTLPESLCRLRNLQMLNLARCDVLQMLPNSLKHLKSLQHLCLKECNSLSSMAPSIGELTSLRLLSMYIVGKERGFRLTELGCLKLKGELHIKHLERVISVTDAKEANLGDKHLNELLLSWDRTEESRLPPAHAEQILESLQPHADHLQTLAVGGYTGVHFPQWMASASLQDLCYVLLVDCKECLNLPPLGKLPSLKTLEISNMNHVKYLDGGVAGDFMALEFLTLDKLPNLIRLSSEEGQNMFPRLSKLQISGCPELALPCLPFLKELVVKGKCNQGLLSSIRNLPSLEYMGFSGDKELTRFPNGMLQNATSLKELKIHDLSRLEELPTEMISPRAIQELLICGCHSLESLPDQLLQQLHSLKILRILENRKFKLSAGLQHLPHLEVLDIYKCPEVEDLPKALQHMTALRFLTLDCLPNLRSLPDWLGNLTMLEELDIFGCPELTCLPMSIQSLPKLKKLHVLSCPQLKKQRVKETGQDRARIIEELLEGRATARSLLYAMGLIRRLPHFIVNDRGV